MHICTFNTTQRPTVKEQAALLADISFHGLTTFPEKHVLFCIIWSHWSWPGMLFVLWIIAHRLMSNPTHLNPSTMCCPWTAKNPDKAITPMYSENCVPETRSDLCGLADASNLFKNILWYFKAEKMDCCVWPRMSWRASFDITFKMGKKMCGGCLMKQLNKVSWINAELCLEPFQIWNKNQMLQVFTMSGYSSY